MDKWLLILLVAYSFWGGIICNKQFGKNPKVVINNNVSENSLSEWEIMKLAIIKTESEFNSLAVGKNDDWGIFQITPIYVKEVNRILGEEKYTHEDAFNPEKAMSMFSIMQNSHNPESDIDKAIASHNPTATSSYSIRVRKNMEFIRQYEMLRQLAQ